MSELAWADYRDYKNAVDNAIGSTVENFVLIGYLLRSARETPELLTGSGYEDYKHFASAEYGLEESQVSRFIAINERYGDGADLLPQYKGYGQSKLSEMLSLPVAVAEELPQTITRAEIRELKSEIKEELKTTDIEVAMERMQNQDIDIWEAFFTDWIKKNPNEFVKMSDDGPEALLEKCSLTARVPGEGKLLLTENEETMTLTSLRSGEKWKCTLDEARAVIFKIARGEELPFPFSEANWEAITGEIFPKIAPAQKTEEKTEKPKATVQKPTESVQKTAESVPEPKETVSEAPKLEEISQEPEEKGEEEVNTSAVEKVEGTVEEYEPQRPSDEQIADLGNMAEIIRECIHGEMWQKAYDTAKDLTMRLERIVESV